MMVAKRQLAHGFSTFFKVVLLVFGMMFSGVAFAEVTHSNDSWQKDMPNATLVGKGKLTLFFFDVYNLSLFTAGKTPIAEDISWRENGYVLQFDYLRDVSKASIVKASIDEMKRVDAASPDDLQKWQGHLNRAIHDMQDGETAAVLFVPDGMATFYASTKPAVHINDKAFATAFSDIWLGESTARPDLKKRILGQ